MKVEELIKGHKAFREDQKNFLSIYPEKEQKYAALALLVDQTIEALELLNTVLKFGQKQYYAFVSNKVLVTTDAMNLCMKAVTEVMGVTEELVRQRRRFLKPVECRRHLIFLIRRLMPEITMMEISRWLQCDHTTCIHAERRANELMDFDLSFRNVQSRLEEVTKKKLMEVLNSDGNTKPS